jgi:LytS/YehU family sensor histidine kinase
VYRYILSQKEQLLVLLEDEFDFIHTYVDLLKLRFGEALILKKEFNGTTAKEFLIPPISAFVALENAVKHNEISEQMPLLISIRIENTTLVIENKLQPKRSIQHSSNIGLKNLEERYWIITGKRIEVQSANNFFTVRLPLNVLTS